MTGPELLGIPVPIGASRDVYSGVARMAGRIWASRHRAARPSRTVLAVVHPASNFLGHYLLAPLAARGVDAVGLTNRYLGNDTTLLMENCVVDIGAAIAFLRERYERVVLVGNSGGGGLSALYQSQAESPTIRSTPAGDPPDLTTATLPPVDGLIELMAHPGRALVYTEWLDPAVRSETDPFARDPDLDLFDPLNKAPYDPDWVVRYRTAQLARNRRITAWVRSELDRISTASQGRVADLPFVVHATTADPRFPDPTLDASDREPGTPWGPPYTANLAPATLGHLTSLRSWLSQWSVDESNCDGPAHIARVSVPVLVVYGTADQVCFPSHARALFDAVSHDRKELVAIPGATHYFQGQPDLVTVAVDHVVDWLARNDLI
jgi:pimeloyl-ACP methyl ester carboxylesterase